MRGRLIPLIICVVLLGGLAAVALGQVGTPSPARAAAIRATRRLRNLQLGRRAADLRRQRNRPGRLRREAG